MRKPNLLLQCELDLSVNHKLTILKDDLNDDNLDACFNKTSRSLGQCILDCNNDSSCETNCVSAFKDEHLECPCQVCGTDRNLYLILLHRKNVH